MNHRASGLRAWIWQRISAVVILLFLLKILYSGLINQLTDYDQWLKILSQRDNSIMLGLLFGALITHSWVGMRDVLIDYIHISWLRHTLIALLALWICALGIWLILILIK